VKAPLVSKGVNGPLASVERLSSSGQERGKGYDGARGAVGSVGDRGSESGSWSLSPKHAKRDVVVGPCYQGLSAWVKPCLMSRS
jgi:hypothetical protein